MHASRYINRLAALLAAAATLASCSWGTLDQPTGVSGQPSLAADTAAGVVPTPTFVPVRIVQPPQFESVSPPAALSQPAPAPPAAEQPAASAPAGGLEPDLQPTPPTIAAGSRTLRLDDDAWYGGWKQGKSYGGRSATWIYGTGTEYNTMEAAFELAGQPVGNALLSIEGMDGENAPKMLISILVNGGEIYSGLNPLPDDDMVLATGTWATYSWDIPAAYLQPGLNTITIVALSEGGFGQPPFMMLDYADLTISG